MITTEGVKSAAESTDPATPYARKPEEKSGAVAKLVIFLASVTLYLKLFLSGKSEAAENEPRERNEQDEAPAPAPAPKVTVVAGGLAGKGADAEPRGGGQQAGRPEATSFEFAPGEDTIAFGAPREVISPVFRPAGYVAQQANDNAAPGRQWPGSSAARDEFAGPGGVTDLEAYRPSGTGVPQPDGHSEKEDVEPDDIREEDANSGADGDGERSRDANRAPRVTGPVVLQDVPAGAVMPIGLAEFLRGAEDPDGGTLHIEAASASSGRLEKVGEATWLFTPGDEVGPVMVSYRISDGETNVKQTLQFDVVEAQPDPQADRNEILTGAVAGDEAVAGHEPGDASGKETGGGAEGGPARGGAGDDILRGNARDNVIFGGAGHDEILGQHGHDTLFGEAGDDLLSGGAGDDRISGGSGDDTLSGEAGSDAIEGGGGSDTIHDGQGEDEVHAGPGDDLVVAAADGDDDHYRGGKGRDAVDYSAAGAAVEIDVMARTARGVDIGEDMISGFERIVGGSGDDLFHFGGDGSISMAGGDGRNAFEFVPTDTGSIAEEVEIPARYEIEDFKVGDRLRMSNWDIFEEGVDESDDRFERLYGEDVDADRVPIRYRGEWADTVDETVIEADLNSDGIYETAVFMDGRHALVLVEAV